MAGRTLDFDAFMDEKNAVVHKVKVFGKYYDVPGRIPAIVPITMARAYEDSISDGDATVMIMRAADQLFGKDAVNEFCRNGMGADQLASLVKMTFGLISGKGVDGDEAETLSDEDSLQTGGTGAKK